MRRHGLFALVAVLALVTACSSRDPRFAPLPVPDAAKGPTTTLSTLPSNLDEVPLRGAPGTTSTSVGIGPGPVTLVGRVDGPDGPVGGALVRLQRLVGNSVASVDVPTASDGSWNAAGILGGHYRIRAWLQPSLGMTRATLVFVESPKPKPVVLRLDSFTGTRVDAAIAPNPPSVGDESNLRIRVSDRVVDAQGVVRTTPRTGVSVTLTGSGSWSVRSSNATSTDAEGTATFLVVCRRSGIQPLSVVLNGSDVEPLDLPACVDASATTTTTAPTTTTTGR